MHIAFIGSSRSHPMQIIREKPCHRRHHRVTAPLTVSMPNGEIITARDWSLGGLRLEGMNGDLPSVGEVLDLTLQLPFQSFGISFDVSAKIVRSDAANGSLALEFVDLSERARDLMSHFIDDLIRGKMATIDDTICRIDMPVTPISTKPDVNPADAVSVRRLPMKTITMSLFYVVLGSLVFGYLGLLIFSKTARMEVDSAVISAPMATLKMPMDGILMPVRMENGLVLRKGQEIARIQNARLNARIDDQAIALEQTKQVLMRSKQRYRIETERMKLYQVITKTDLQISEARVASATEALAAADANFARMKGLHKKGLVQTARFEEALKRRAEAEAHLLEAQAKLERSTAMGGVSDRKYYNHKEFVTDLDMLALSVDEAQSAFALALMKMEKLQDSQSQLKIRAPFDGEIVSVQQTGLTNVLRNEPLLTIQQNVTPTVTAYLNQDQVLRVGLHDRVKIFIPSTGQHLEAVVEKIDRNSALLHAGDPTFTWKDGEDKSATVSLALDIRDQASSQVPAGLPVIAIFQKRTINDIYHKLTGALSKTRTLVRSAHDLTI